MYFRVKTEDSKNIKIQTDTETEDIYHRRSMFIPFASALLSTFGILIYEFNLLDNQVNNEILLRTSSLIALYGMTYLRPKNK